MGRARQGHWGQAQKGAMGQAPPEKSIGYIKGVGLGYTADRY